MILRTCDYFYFHAEYIRCATSCISLFSMCNGYNDCSDGWDEVEENCLAVDCPRGKECITIQAKFLQKES